MKKSFGFIILAIFVSCNTANQNNKTETPSIRGTWKLLTGTLIDKKDTVVTDYTKGKEFIKIINGDHFAFLSHDLPKKITDSSFSAGGGKYSLNGNQYTEYLQYCNDRQWEGNEFHFTVDIHSDTLIQTGVEKIDSLGINRLNIEKYLRVKKHD